MEKSSYSFEAHHPIKMKGHSVSVCAHCGLVYLRNNFTRWSIDKGCLSDYHPEYQREWKKAGKGV